MIRSLALIVVLLLAGVATAQINHPYNEAGIFMVEQPVGCETAQVDVPAGGEFWCYLVLSNPYNEALGRPVATVGGFEFRLGFPEGCFLLGAVYPPGNTVDCIGCFPDFLSNAPMPVSGGHLTLMQFRILVTTAEPDFLFLSPLAALQSIPGAMAFTDLDDGHSPQVMHPISGSFDVPVFAINWDGELSFCETVPTRDASFGEVKALYR